MLIISTGISPMLQKNGTPLENPIRSGGSPIGVRHPPMFDTRKIKKIMICLLFFLHEFICMIGRTKSILAPVVPIQLEKSVPTASVTTLTIGLPIRFPSSLMFPATQNNPKSRTINVR